MEANVKTDVTEAEARKRLQRAMKEYGTSLPEDAEHAAVRLLARPKMRLVGRALFWLVPDAVWRWWIRRSMPDERP